jgi:proton glutamate symport protein
LKKKIPKYIFIVLLSALTLTVFVHTLDLYKFVEIPAFLLLSLRLLTIATLFWYAIKKRSLTTWILISMVAGAEFGHDLPEIAKNLQVISKIFLRLVKTVIAPLLFATLVYGIAGHSNLKQVGRMGWKSLLYFEIVSTIALFIGLAAINISKAGEGISFPVTQSQQVLQNVPKQETQDLILNIFPENFVKAIYLGEILQIVVFCIMFGISVALISEKYRRPMITFTESLSEVMFKFMNLVMYFAPFAVFAAIAYTVGHMGIDVLMNLLKLLLTLYAALIGFLVFVLIPIMLILKIPVRNFFRAISEPASLAFATTSSESALPKAMEAMEKFGVPRKIVAFVMPTGYSFNLDGTTLYLSLATIFIAQVGGIHLSFAQQILIVLTLMLTSKGVAGIPRASLVILLATAASFGLPVEPIFIILGIDELMDMARTAINVTGNCLATVVVAKWEGEFDSNAARNYVK